MDILSAIIQGIVQGLTEFLPISSSGHLVLAQHILGIRENNLFFNVMLHTGTLLAVIAFYHKKIIALIKAFFEIVKDMTKGEFRIGKSSGDKNFAAMIIIGLFPLFLLFLPVAPGAMDIKDFAESFSDGKYIAVPGLFLLLTSLLLTVGINSYKRHVKNEIERKSGRVFSNDRKTYISIYDALLIGLTQFLAAVFPGLSRSGSTLAVGLMRGINKKTALEYSFILGTPAVLAATLLELKEAIESGAIYSIDMLPVIVGMVVSAVVGFMAIKLFKWLLNKDRMNIFIIYTFIVGVLTVILGVIEIISGVNIFTGEQL